MKMGRSILSPSTCFLFDGLDKAQRAAASSSLPPPTPYANGATVVPCHDGERALGVLLAGTARIRRIGTDGKPQTCNRLTAGDAFGVAALFSENEPVSEIRAEKDCIVQFVPESVLLALMHTYPPVSENLVRFLTDRIRFLNRSLNGLRGGTAAQRLLSYLETQADDTGALTLPPLSSLASKLDMGRTSLYRALDELEQAGALVRDGKAVTLTHLL